MNRCLVNHNPKSFDLDAIFNSVFDSPMFNFNQADQFSPRVNIIDSDDKVTLTFEMPGMDKDAIKVIVKNNILTVSGERKLERKVEDNNFVRSEIGGGSFSRSFNLPDTIEIENMTAEYKNGLLEIKLNKKELAKPKEVSVKIS